MIRVNMHQAETSRSALVANAEAGETIELMRAGKITTVPSPRGMMKRKLERRLR
jgi:antitoxin (DNA-binding transcriptional repressor) of toxin-antitoxin stability system